MRGRIKDLSSDSRIEDESRKERVDSNLKFSINKILKILDNLKIYSLGK